MLTWQKSPRKEHKKTIGIQPDKTENVIHLAQIRQLLKGSLSTEQFFCIHIHPYTHTHTRCRKIHTQIYVL